MGIRNYMKDRKRRRQEAEAESMFQSYFSYYTNKMQCWPSLSANRLSELFTIADTIAQQQKVIDFVSECTAVHPYIHEQIENIIIWRPDLDPGIRQGLATILTSAPRGPSLRTAARLLRSTAVTDPALRQTLMDYLRKGAVSDGKEVSDVEKQTLRDAVLLLHSENLSTDEIEIVLDIHETALARQPAVAMSSLGKAVTQEKLPQAVRRECLKLLKKGFRHDIASAAENCFRLAADPRPLLREEEIHDLVSTASQWLRYSLEQDEPWNRNNAAQKLVEAAARENNFGGHSVAALAFVAAAVDKNLVFPEAWPRETYQSWQAAKRLAAIFNAPSEEKKLLMPVKSAARSLPSASAPDL